MKARVRERLHTEVRPRCDEIPFYTSKLIICYLGKIHFSMKKKSPLHHTSR